MITIGSILAMIIAGINQVGVIDFFDDSEENNEMDTSCDPNWEFVNTPGDGDVIIKLETFAN